MNSTIRKTNNISPESNLVVLAKNNTKFKNYNFSKQEQSYIEKELTKKDKKLIVINQYTRFVFIQKVDEKKELYQTLENFRKAGDGITGLANKQKIEELTVVDEGVGGQNVLAFVEGMILSNYQFIKYKKDKKKLQNSLKNINVFSDEADKEALKKLSIETEATIIARNLVNEPVSTLNATALAEEFKLLGKEAGFDVEVLNKNKIQSLKMGGLLAVNQGSIDPPTFTIMEYKPSKAINKSPIVLIGKGVVYDTGGLSLKPTANSMDSMKCDMAGGATVGAVLYGIAKKGLPVHVIGLVPATDNRPGGNAFAPGDVITMYNGSTVEMLNSDAEGRMILADALSYAKQFKPELVIDLATLTGAASAAIGPYGIVCMGTADENIKQALKKSGEMVYERLAEFPFWDEYDELLKSDIADMKNIGGPTAGAITAGKFLQRFTDYPWMHFDIAGPAFVKSANSYRGQNGTGVGVRLLLNFLTDRSRKK